MKCLLRLWPSQISCTWKKEATSTWRYLLTAIMHTKPISGGRLCTVQSSTRYLQCRTSDDLTRGHALFCPNVLQAKTELKHMGVPGSMSTTLLQLYILVNITDICVQYYSTESSTKGVLEEKSCT